MVVDDSIDDTTPETLFIAKEQLERAHWSLCSMGTQVSLAVLRVIAGRSDVIEETVVVGVSFRPMLRIAGLVGRRLSGDLP
jgi:hypothetical protein